MASPVLHSACGLSTTTSAVGPSQIFCNALTGEVVTIARTTPMILLNEFYTINFTGGGWAYFEGLTDDGKKHQLWYRSIDVKTIAVQTKAGRIAIQDLKDKTKTKWLDAYMQSHTVRIVQMALQEKLTCVVFDVERNILEQTLKFPHEIDGKVFLEFRCFEPMLALAASSDVTLTHWTKKNFQNCKEMWYKLYIRAGGSESTKGHFIPSQKSWTAAREAASNSVCFYCKGLYLNDRCHFESKESCKHRRRA